MPNPFYELTAAIDAGTGDLLLDGAEVAAGAPLAEVVSFVLRTERGSYAPDPSVGIVVPDKALPSAAADLAASIREQLAFLTKPGLLTNLAVTVEAQRNVLAFEVSFVDPRASSQRPQTLRGRI